MSSEGGGVGHPEGGAQHRVELLRLVGRGEPEGVALLDVVLTAGVPRHVAEQAAGRVTGGVGNPLERLTHHDLRGRQGGDGDSL